VTVRRAGDAADQVRVLARKHPGRVLTAAWSVGTSSSSSSASMSWC